eukprot:SAG25_NODE_13992_length_260_cov_0.757764_1_plen_71_part_01
MRSLCPQKENEDEIQRRSQEEVRSLREQVESLILSFNSVQPGGDAASSTPGSTPSTTPRAAAAAATSVAFG